MKRAPIRGEHSPNLNTTICLSFLGKILAPFDAPERGHQLTTTAAFMTSLGAHLATPNGRASRAEAEPQGRPAAIRMLARA